MTGRSPVMASGEPEALVSLARKALRQPGDSARHDDHLVVADGGRDVVPALADRQFRGVANGRALDSGRAGGFSGGGALRGPGRVRDRVRGNFVHQRERLDDRYW